MTRKKGKLGEREVDRTVAAVIPPSLPDSDADDVDAGRGMCPVPQHMVPSAWGHGYGPMLNWAGFISSPAPSRWSETQVFLARLQLSNRVIHLGVNRQVQQQQLRKYHLLLQQQRPHALPWRNLPSWNRDAGLNHAEGVHLVDPYSPEAAQPPATATATAPATATTTTTAAAPAQRRMPNRTMVQVVSSSSSSSGSSRCSRGGSDAGTVTAHSGADSYDPGLLADAQDRFSDADDSGAFDPYDPECVDQYGDFQRISLYASSQGEDERGEEDEDEDDEEYASLTGSEAEFSRFVLGLRSKHPSLRLGPLRRITYYLRSLSVDPEDLLELTDEQCQELTNIPELQRPFVELERAAGYLGFSSLVSWPLPLAETLQHSIHIGQDDARAEIGAVIDLLTAGWCPQLHLTFRRPPVGGDDCECLIYDLAEFNTLYSSVPEHGSFACLTTVSGWHVDDPESDAGASGARAALPQLNLAHWFPDRSTWEDVSFSLLRPGGLVFTVHGPDRMDPDALASVRGRLLRQLEKSDPPVRLHITELTGLAHALALLGDVHTRLSSKGHAMCAIPVLEDDGSLRVCIYDMKQRDWLLD